MSQYNQGFWEIGLAGMPVAIGNWMELGLPTEMLINQDGGSLADTSWSRSFPLRLLVLEELPADDSGLCGAEVGAGLVVSWQLVPRSAAG